MRVLVTGGAGFIGSNLVEYLLKKECEVIVIDNLTSGFKNNIDEFMERRLLFPNYMYPDKCEFVSKFLPKKTRYEKNSTIKGGIRLPCSNSGVGDGNVFGYYADSFSKNLTFLEKTEEKVLITFILGCKKNPNSVLFIPEDVIKHILHMYVQKVYQSSRNLSFFDYSRELCRQFVTKSNMGNLPLEKIHFMLHYTQNIPKSKQILEIMHDLKKTEQYFF